jgi:hypothetical protein
MKLFRYLAWLFVSPSRLFDEIREDRAGWVHAWIILSVIYLAITWIGLPVQRVLLELNPAGMPADQLDRQIEMMDKYGKAQLVFAPALVLVTGMLVAGVSYVLVTVLSSAATFRRYFTLSLFASIVPGIGYLLTTTAVRLRGLEQIVEPSDARFSLSLRALAPEGGAALAGLFGTFEFFTIWSFILLAMGLRRVFGMSTGAAVACLVPVWLIYAALAILGEVMGGGLAG